MPQQTAENQMKRSSFTDSLKEYSSKIDSLIHNSRLPKFLKNKFILGAIIILIIILIISSLTSSSVDLTNIPTYNVKRGKFLVSITESGELRAKKSITVSAPRIRGNLKIVDMVPEGTIVKPGDVIVKFDPSEALTKLDEAKSQLEIAESDKKKLLANHKSATAQMESQLKSAELSYELSKLNLSQMKFEAEVKQQEAKLQHQKNELSFEQTKQEFESMKIIQQSELDKMEIEIKQKKNELSEAEKELELLTLTAPAEGLVVYAPNWGNQGRKYAIGDQPWRGAGIIELPDLSEMESITYVNEVDVSKVKSDQETIVKLDAFQDSSFSGNVTSVASIGKNKENNVNIKVFEVVIDILQKSEVLKPGMTTSNQIVMNEIDDVIFIPQEAVFEIEGKRIAFVKNGNDFDEVEITLGEKSEDYVIVSAGLKENDVVALQNPEIVEEETATEEETVPVS